MTTKRANSTLWPAQVFMVLLLMQGPVWTVEADIFDASEFTNIVFGANSNWTLNGLTYIPDNFGVGNASTITAPVPGGPQFLKYFQPAVSGTRNLYCFSLNLASGKALVRATFQYGNYDLKQQPPAFNVLLKTTLIATVNLSLSDAVIEEVIVDGLGTNWPFCLLAIPGGGSPVISLLEARPLPVGSYKTENTSVILKGMYRIDCGNTAAPLRYPNDTFDRIWGIDQGWKPVLPNATAAISIEKSINLAQVGSPLPVMQSYRELVSLGELTYSLRLSSEVRSYQVTGYFANLENGSAPVFNITANSIVQGSFYTAAPVFAAMQHTFALSASDWLNYSLVGIRGFPFLNALEVFEVMNVGPQTNSQDVGALQTLKSSYGVIGDWDNSDPCLPSPWQRVVCSSDVVPRVTELLLSGFLPRPTILYSLGDLDALKTLELQNNSLSTNQIQVTYPSNLQVLNLSYNLLTSVPTFDTSMALETLDLGHNRIEGPIPDLRTLTRLKRLDLSYNRFTGLIPDWLSSSDIVVNFCGNHLTNVQCDTAPTSNPVLPASKSKKSNGVVVGAAVGGGTLLLFILFSSMILVYWRQRKPRNKDAESTQQGDIRNWTAAKRFSLKQLSAATQNFKNVLGHGGFGTVYFGTLSGGQEVAVKLRADKSRIGVSAFGNEVDLLSRVHHRNLVTLLGFCDEAGKQCLVYEYIPNGTLADHLYGSHAKTSPLDFRTRLMTAIGAATGIEYLHTSCNPMIIHRDIKTTNILLDDKLEAKVCDFGLSKVVVNSHATHVTTAVKGTAGYLDPEYYVTQQLTEKSDVYSFGVVLLEMLCAREPLSSSLPPDEYSLIAWALPHLRGKSYSTVLDPSLEGLSNTLSLEIVAHLVVRSLERLPANRPTMTDVLNDLKRALSLVDVGKDIGDNFHPERTSNHPFKGRPQAR